MGIKPLAEMSFTELAAELAAAQSARGAAEYQEGLDAWRAATAAADARLAAVNAEIDARLAKLGTPAGGAKHGTE